MTVSCEYNKKKNGNFFVVVDFLHHVNALDKPWALPELGLWRLHLAQVLIQVMMPASGGYPTHTLSTIGDALIIMHLLITSD